MWPFKLFCWWIGSLVQHQKVLSRIATFFRKFSNQQWSENVMKPQNGKIHNLVILGLLLESLEKTYHSNITPMTSHEIRKKVMTFLKFKSYCVLMSSCLFMIQPCTILVPNSILHLLFLVYVSHLNPIPKLPHLFHPGRWWTCNQFVIYYKMRINKVFFRQFHYAKSKSASQRLILSSSWNYVPNSRWITLFSSWQSHTKDGGTTW